MVGWFYSRTFFPFFQGPPLTSLLCFIFCFLSPIPSSSWRKNNSFLLVNCILAGGTPGGSEGKESACNAGDPGLILASGRSLGKESSTSRIQGNPQDERHRRMRKRERERERETRPGMCSRVWQLLYFSPSPLYPKLAHF